jgi:hypothetical protein
MEQTSLNIGTIGQKLESARQAKGVSVSEAGQATKILSKFIEAMEADDFGVLSAPVYAKSFIKMYAKYLGIDDRPLVDEYVEQHAPKAQRQLADEVRQNLANTDQLAVETAPSSSADEGSHIFGDVNQAIARISGSRLSPKMLAIAGGGVLVILIVLLSVTQCADDDEDVPTPAAGGAASVERQLLFDGSPDVYLVKPDEIVID